MTEPAAIPEHLLELLRQQLDVVAAWCEPLPDALGQSVGEASAAPGEQAPAPGLAAAPLDQPPPPLGAPAMQPRAWQDARRRATLHGLTTAVPILFSAEPWAAAQASPLSPGPSSAAHASAAMESPWELSSVPVAPSHPFPAREPRPTEPDQAATLVAMAAPGPGLAPLSEGAPSPGRASALGEARRVPAPGPDLITSHERPVSSTGWLTSPTLPSSPGPTSSEAATSERLVPYQPLAPAESLEVPARALWESPRAPSEAAPQELQAHETPAPGPFFVPREAASRTASPALLRATSPGRGAGPALALIPRGQPSAPRAPPAALPVLAEAVDLSELEENLADVLERVALEAGVDLS